MVRTSQSDDTYGNKGVRTVFHATPPTANGQRPATAKPKPRKSKVDYNQLGSTLSGAARQLIQQNELPQQEEEAPTSSLLDFLRQAQGLVGSGGGGTNFSSLRGTLSDQANNADARIAAMYKQLGDSYRGDAAGIAQSYDNTAAAQQKAAQDAAASVEGGYDASRARQTEQLAALGIGDAAGVMASQPGGAGGDQAAALANIQQNQAASANQTAANKQAALTQNISVGNAAQLEGNMQRAAIQQQLASRLAELQSQESQSTGNNFGQALSLGQALYGEQQDKLASKAQSEQDFAQFMAEQQGTQAKLEQNSKQNQQKLYQNFLKIYGGDDQKALAQLSQLQKLGLV